MNQTIRLVVAVTALSALGAAFGCEGPDTRTQEAKQEARQEDAAAIAAAPADNTKKNERDRDDASLTPTDQGGGADRSVTQAVRQSIMKDDSVSFTGKNVKVITVDGVVTLRGPVDSAAERTTIGALAEAVPGVKSVDNQLEVAAK